MFDSVVIGNKDSFYDYEASMKEREIGEPKKKSIKETVPFSNVVYDFTKINGEIYWEERPLTYVFEITADSPEFLEVKKQDFKAWVMNVHEENLYDPYIEHYHFVATFDDIKCDDSEIEKSTITVAFTAYPYMVANQKTTKSCLVNASGDTDIDDDFQANIGGSTDTEYKYDSVVSNLCDHRIKPTFFSIASCYLIHNGVTYEIPANEEFSSDDILLEVGDNELEFQAKTAYSHLVDITYYEEVL